METRDFYAVVLTSGNFIKVHSLNSLLRYDSNDVECYLQAEYVTTYKTPRNSTDWYRFSFIDRSGNPVSLRRGNFEVLSLSHDEGCSNFFYRIVYIKDVRTGRCFNMKSRSWFNTFIHHDIIPMLDQLNKCTSDDEIAKLVDDFETYEELKEKCKRLEAKLMAISGESAAR